jgi:flagellar motor switch protein FliN/FliY
MSESAEPNPATDRSPSSPESSAGGEQQLTSAGIEQFEKLKSTWLSHLTENLEALVTSFQQATDLATQFRVKELSAEWVTQHLAIQHEPWPAGEAAGLVVELACDETFFVALLPEIIGLPGWYTTPDASQESRLQTLAQEWSILLLPESIEIGTSKTITVSRIAGHVENLPLHARLLAYALEVTTLENPPEEDETPAIIVLGPFPLSAKDGQPSGSSADAASGSSQTGMTGVTPQNFEDEWEEASADLETERRQNSSAERQPPDSQAAVAPVDGPVDDLLSNYEGLAAQDPMESESPLAQQTMPQQSVTSHLMLQRLSGVRVQLSVRLAEKRMPLAALLQLSPGALVTFNKPCEDLLDIYIGNRQYAQGEAVKIGEHFGVKVNRLGPPPEKPSSLILD